MHKAILSRKFQMIKLLIFIIPVLYLLSFSSIETTITRLSDNLNDFTVNFLKAFYKPTILIVILALFSMLRSHLKQADNIMDSMTEEQKIDYDEKLRDYHERTKNVFQALMKQKLLTRKDITEFKKELNKCLGSHCYDYSNYTFKNDFHEIYGKLKNENLMVKDFEYLLNYLSALVNSKTKQVPVKRD